VAEKKPGRDGNPLALKIGRNRERDGTASQFVRDMREHPIDLMRDRRIIKSHHYTAAELFLDDWEAASISPLRAAKLEKGVDNGRGSTLADMQLEALRQVGDALASLSNVDRAIVMLIVVYRFDLKTLTAHMQREGFNWNNRVAGPRVAEALEALAAAYGLTTRYIVSSSPIEE
jgi:hypothetical protein